MAATRPHRTTTGPVAGDRPALAATWSLEIQTGDDGVTRVLDLEHGPIRVGRGIQCEVRLNQVGLGDVQCIIRRRGDEWQVQPVGPPGRIWVDNQPSDNQRALPPGVTLRVGRATLTLHEANPDLRERGSFNAPISIDAQTEVPAGSANLDVAPADIPPAPAEPVPPSVEDTGPPPPSPGEASDDRLKRWQTRLDQRDQWLQDRQNEKRWEARWKAAGESLRSRSTTPTPTPPPAPAPARPEPTPRPPTPAPAAARIVPGRTPPARSFEPRPVFGHTRRPTEPTARVESPPLAPISPEPIAPAAPASTIPDARPPEPEIAVRVTVNLDPPAVVASPADLIAPSPEPVPPAAEAIPPAPVEATPVAAVALGGLVLLPETQPGLPQVVARPDPIAPISPTPVEPAAQVSIAPSLADPAPIAVPDEPTDPERPSPARSSRTRSIRTGTRLRSPLAPLTGAAAADPTPDPAEPLASPAARLVPARGPVTRLEPEPTPFGPARSARLPGSESAPVIEPAEPKVWPSARAIFAAQGTRATGGLAAEPTATPGPAGKPTRVRPTPEPTEVVRPDEWTIPLLLGWVPTAMLVLAFSLFAVGLAVVWIEDGSSGNIALRLATRPDGAYAPVVDAQSIPRAAWWQTTASHLAAWSLVMERVGNGEDRSADARLLEADARAVSPLGARARFVSEPVPGQEADVAASIRLGPTRDIITLTAMAHRLRRENKRLDAIRAYRAAFLTAATTARSNLGRPVFRVDPTINRYAMPHSGLLDEVARDMAGAGDWTAAEWAEATPDFAPALLAVATALRTREPAESERRLEAICRVNDRALDPRFEAAEDQAAIAEALAERGRWTDAVTQYRRAVDGEPRDLDRRVWWFNLAEVARKAGDTLVQQQAIESAKGTDLSDEVTQRAANVAKDAPDPGRGLPKR